MKKLIPKLIGSYLNLLTRIAPGLAGRQGFYLFCTPQSAPLKAHQKQFLQTAERSSFISDGNLIQVYRWGSGPKKVLFLHGWQSHSFRWKNYIDAFPQDQYTLYALDAPGHGQSGGKYLNIPRYSQAIERFLKLTPGMHAVVSHSLGSFAALYTFFRYPALAAQKLIITASPGEAQEFFNFFQNILGLSQRAVWAVNNSFLELIGQLPEYFSATKFAGKLSIPGLIIHDERDEETSYRHALDIQRAWKNSKLITTTGLGHNLRSGSVVKHVFDFIHEPNEQRHQSAPISERMLVS